ncbi:MAG: hypothetical protein HY735_20725 [Verrucomicrobia bacterium]|nr:hypothetical protein [Verrucomicrobiota bacterium]
MNIAELEQQLLAAARSNPPSDGVPYAFEQRVMARITSECLADVWGLWERLLWRAAAPCVGVMLALTVWTLMSTSSNGSSENLAVALENSVMAPLARLEDSW